MIEQMVRRLRRSMRQTDVRIKEYCSSQVPAEVSRYTLSQMRAIDTLYELTREAGGGIQLKLLANTLAITPAAASEMVDTLVRREIVERRHSENDRRAVEIRLQPTWLELFRRHEHNYDARVNAFFADRPAERAEFERVVDELNCFLVEHKDGADQ